MSDCHITFDDIKAAESCPCELCKKVRRLRKESPAPVDDWKERRIMAFRNKKTGSVDWRGDHPLATVYSDEYYLSRLDEWQPIYEGEKI